jgi:hypothetical protein
MSGQGGQGPCPGDIRYLENRYFGGPLAALDRITQAMREHIQDAARPPWDREVGVTHRFENDRPLTGAAKIRQKLPFGRPWELGDFNPCIKKFPLQASCWTQPNQRMADSGRVIRGRR